MAKKTNAELTTEINELMNTVAMLRGQVTASNETIVSLEQEVKNFKASGIELAKDNTELKNIGRQQQEVIAEKNKLIEELKNEIEALRYEEPNYEEDSMYDNETTDPDSGMPRTTTNKERLLDEFCARVGISERRSPFWEEMVINADGDVFHLHILVETFGTRAGTNANAYKFMGKLQKHCRDLGLQAWFQSGALHVRTLKRKFQ